MAPSLEESWSTYNVDPSVSFHFIRPILCPLLREHDLRVHKEAQEAIKAKALALAASKEDVKMETPEGQEEGEEAEEQKTEALAVDDNVRLVEEKPEPVRFVYLVATFMIKTSDVYTVRHGILCSSLVSL